MSKLEDFIKDLDNLLTVDLVHLYLSGFFIVDSEKYAELKKKYLGSSTTCSRCGKEITEKSIAVSTEDLDGYTEQSYWCQECYESFMKELSSPTKAFADIKPAIKDKGNSLLKFEDKHENKI